MKLSLELLWYKKSRSDLQDVLRNTGIEGEICKYFSDIGEVSFESLNQWKENVSIRMFVNIFLLSFRCWSEKSNLYFRRWGRRCLATLPGMCSGCRWRFLHWIIGNIGIGTSLLTSFIIGSWSWSRNHFGRTIVTIIFIVTIEKGSFITGWFVRKWQFQFFNSIFGVILSFISFMSFATELNLN